MYTGHAISETWINKVVLQVDSLFKDNDIYHAP